MNTAQKCASLRGRISLGKFDLETEEVVVWDETGVWFKAGIRDVAQALGRPEYLDRMAASCAYRMGILASARFNREHELH